MTLAKSCQFLQVQKSLDAQTKVKDPSIYTWKLAQLDTYGTKNIKVFV